MASSPLTTVGLVLLIAGAGCAQRSAESAIATAEKEIAGLQAEAEKIAPNELRALTDSVAAMKVRVAAGDYSGALMGARSANSMARDLSANLATRKEQLTTSFNAAVAELPSQLQAVTARVNELSAMRRLPQGVDAGQLATLKSEVGNWASQWSSASESFAAGNLASALSVASDLRVKLADAMKALSIS